MRAWHRGFSYDELYDGKLAEPSHDAFGNYRVMHGCKSCNSWYPIPMTTALLEMHHSKIAAWYRRHQQSTKHQQKLQLHRLAQ